MAYNNNINKYRGTQKGKSGDENGCPPYPQPGSCPPGWVHNPPYPICGPCEEINPNVRPPGGPLPVDPNLEIQTVDPNVYHIWEHCRTGEKFNITWDGQVNSPMNGNQFYTDIQDIVAASIYAGPWWQAAGAGYLPDIVIGQPKSGECYAYVGIGLVQSWIAWSTASSLAPLPFASFCQHCDESDPDDWCSFALDSPCVLSSGLLQTNTDVYHFLQNQDIHYNNQVADWGGCGWFTNRIIMWEAQLDNTYTGWNTHAWVPNYGNVNPNALLWVQRKVAKVNWALCMREKCCNVIPDPDTVAKFSIFQDTSTVNASWDNRDKLDSLQIPIIKGDEGTKEIIACPCGWQPVFTDEYNSSFKGSPMDGTWHCLIPDCLIPNEDNNSILADHLGTVTIDGGIPTVGDKYYKPSEFLNLSWDTWDIFHVGDSIKTRDFGNAFSEKIELISSIVARGDSNDTLPACQTSVDDNKHLENQKSLDGSKDGFIIPSKDVLSANSSVWWPTADCDLQVWYDCFDTHLQSFDTAGTLDGSAFINTWQKPRYLNAYYNSGGVSGCSWFENRINFWTNQLSDITAPIHLAQKNAKIDWAICMQTHCCEFEPDPCGKLIDQSNTCLNCGPCEPAIWEMNLNATIDVVMQQYNLPGTVWNYPHGFLNYQQTGFYQWYAAGGDSLAAGCAWFDNKITQWTNQLANITAPIHYALKSAKIAWANLMLDSCGCKDVQDLSTRPTSLESDSLNQVIIDRGNSNNTY